MSGVIVSSIIIATGASNIFSCVAMSFGGVFLRSMLGSMCNGDILSGYSSLFSLIVGFVACFRFIPVFSLPFVFICVSLPPLPVTVSYILMVICFISVLISGDWLYIGPAQLVSDILLSTCSALCITSIGGREAFLHILFSVFLYSGNRAVLGFAIAFVLSRHATFYLDSSVSASTFPCSHMEGRFCFLLFSACLAASASVFHQFYLAVSSSIVISTLCFYAARLILSPK